MVWRYAIHSNGKVRRAEPYPFAAQLSLAAAQAARALIASCPAYRVTPLRRLDEVARALGVAQVWYKDEASRFGLGSFKALGGAYAVALALAERISGEGPPVAAADVAAGHCTQAASALTVACASDGNHGRAVAAGARRFGARCVVFLHEGVSAGRAEAIRELGAEVVRTPGAYDQSVRQAAETCARRGWILVSDTAQTPADPGPLRVMQGYTVIAAEVLDQLRAQDEAPPTHVMLQGGVGGLAAALVAHLWEELGPQKPTFIVVEPERADCLLQSARAGAPRPTSTADLETVMAGLACGEVSRAAWPVLEAGVEYFMTVEDDAAVAAMRRLAEGGIVAGESGAAGLAGLLALRAAGERGPLPADLGPQSRVLVIGTEGATDPAIYRQLTDAAA